MGNETGLMVRRNTSDGPIEDVLEYFMQPIIDVGKVHICKHIYKLSVFVHASLGYLYVDLFYTVQTFLGLCKWPYNYLMRGNT